VLIAADTHPSAILRGDSIIVSCNLSTALGLDSTPGPIGLWSRDS
jgi:hypothetical protein